ncbi:hypothetical protein HHK36_006796 [Tetracentron sinense]|uniref:Anaphase-promoting complex subunit 4 WD40 domain-containing protein n=1 Tax=Tetracentron sinense TaxID=13715 RepID=A0A834ZQE5_TETSI|nr:hypothetical protein HHK36_006796 [Tetracentron sinense]
MKEEAVSSSNGSEATNLLSAHQFEEEIKEMWVVYALVGKPNDGDVEGSNTYPTEIVQLLEEIRDVIPLELPSGLPPMRSIQHAIDLLPRASLPNQAIYHMPPMNRLEMLRQVEDLIQKGLCNILCRWFEWDAAEDTKIHKLGIKSSEKVLTQLEDVGQQLALTFNNQGSILAVGGEDPLTWTVVGGLLPVPVQDGYLRVFKWPSMEVIFDKTDAHAAVKNLDFSLDGKFLVSLGSGGPCKVWDVTSSTIVASLPKENDEVFGFCKFSQSSGNNQILYITAMRGQGGSIVSWNTTSWKRVGSKQVVRDPICAFDVSADGKLLAIGTIQGDILIMNSNMRVQTVVRKAHLGLVTALMFSQDSRALVSTSLDSSARVTLIKEKKQQIGLSFWVIILIVLLAILANFLKSKGFNPY